MNNAANPTSPAHRQSRAPRRPRRINTSHGIATHASPAAPAQNAAAAGDARSSVSTKEKEGLAKKLQFLTNLASNLDMLVFAELCAVYYMDCSFFRLAIRWTVQTIFLSPHSSDTVLVVPNLHIPAIFGPNAFCFFLHMVTALPQATEISRGYLHGGILFDFVGQKPPSSKITLLLLDLIILVLQVVMLAVNNEREKIRSTLNPPRVTNAAGETVATTETVARAQDLDAEERGVLRGDSVGNDDGDLEMQTLDTNGRGQGERTALLGRRGSSSRSSEGAELADVLRSGNATLSNFDIPQALRTAWRNHGSTPQNAAAYTLQSMGYNATLAALAAQRNARRAAAQQRQT